MKSLIVALVRLQGLSFLLYALIDSTYLPQYHRAMMTLHATAEQNTAAGDSFFLAVFRVGLNLVAGILLLVAGEKIVGWLRLGVAEDPK